MRDVVIAKAGSIQKCIRRAREELDLAGDSFRLLAKASVIQNGSEDLLRFTEIAVKVE